MKTTFAQIREDIKFLIDQMPTTDPDAVVPNLPDFMYYTKSYTGDVRLAKRIQDMCVRYEIDLNDDEDKDE